jgi:hypothetical protein
MIRRYCPTVLVVSPPCTVFSIANQGEVDPQTLAGAVEMIRFSMEICELQHRAGRHFIFEQPQSSRAWNLDDVLRMSYQGGGWKGPRSTSVCTVWWLVTSQGQPQPTNPRPCLLITPHWRVSFRTSAEVGTGTCTW